MAFEETNVRHLGAFRKNKATETRVVAKTVNASNFIDVREWTVAEGADPSTAIATRKGTMIRREHVPDVILMMLSDLTPEDIRGDGDVISKIMAEVDRLTGS